MPQHKSKQTGQLLLGKKQQQGQSSTPADAAHTFSEQTWQRSQGAFSGKAKKEYLKWKRRRKEAADGRDSDDPGGNRVQTCSTRRTALNDKPTGISQANAILGGVEQQSSAPDGSTDDPAQPLMYRPLVTVPAAPFTAVVAAVQLPDLTDSLRGEAGCAVGKSDVVLQDEAADFVYMPVLDPAEVGFTAEGCQLTMPTRPAWQGVVSSAEELHALEEQHFQAWQEALLRQGAAQPACNNSSSSSSSDSAEGTGMSSSIQQPTARAGGVGRLSFYEGRLEFWRQLWRTLEMSDIVVMIVDARNPLLHFSQALYRHITEDHRLPLLLLLNKCDLIPAAAAAAWQTWLQQQLPGVPVLPVSAAAGEAEAAARLILGAVLQQYVERGGQQVRVQQFVGQTADELILESLERNVHAKRHVMHQQQHQESDATTTAAAAADLSSIPGTDTAAGTLTGDTEECSTPTGALSVDSNDSDNDWRLKPGRKAGARKGGSRRATNKTKRQMKQVPGRAANRACKLSEAAATGRCSCAATAAVPNSDKLEHTADHCATDSESEDESEADSVCDSDSDQQLAALNNLLENLTLERQVSRIASCCASSVSGSAAAAGAASAAGAAAAAGAATTTAAVAAAEEGDTASAAAWRCDSRPVVIGLLGEPNVGKSSTLNALLGTHRVAVSCHPGLTKHYQTHFMSDKLVLCDCPGIVFPRLDVSLPMQVLFGSYPIASCRQPYAVLRYLASASWPRLQQKLSLKHPGQTGQQQQQQHTIEPNSISVNASRGRTDQLDATGAASCAEDADSASDAWSPWALCEALCVKRSWTLPRSGRLDTYRAANWLLRAALGGKQGLGLAFMPPSP